MSEKTMYTAQEIDDIVKSCRGLRKQLIEYCMKYLASFEDAEDCVSFAFTKLVEELKDGKAITSPKAWLYKVSINEAIRLAREANKRCENLFRDSEYKDAVIEESEVYEPDYLHTMSLACTSGSTGTGLPPEEVLQGRYAGEPAWRITRPNNPCKGS